MRVHTGEKLYACDLCNYRAAQNSTLSRHMRVHTSKQSVPHSSRPAGAGHIRRRTKGRTDAFQPCRQSASLQTDVAGSECAISDCLDRTTAFACVSVPCGHQCV
mmetsp:Transcript_14584/g.37517  ORF Transcript_14584/g.37517 Transcript_14584/m.37517 type:complete len:104 (+) Transcript_14584:108-419(+)